MNKAPEHVARSRSEINRDIDADYYGYRDEEDGILLEYEQALEKELIEKMFNAPDEERVVEKENQQQSDMMEGVQKESDDSKNALVPSQKEVEVYLVQRRKQQVKCIYLYKINLLMSIFSCWINMCLTI
jgi:pre-mRNA-splicing factor ISY1